MDRRIRRTRAALVKALFELITEVGYDAITITDIMDRADLRRATFYLHYGHKDELLIAALATIFDELEEALLPYRAADHLAGKSSTAIYRALFAHAAAHAALYTALFASTQAAFLVSQQIQQRLAQDIESSLSDAPTAVPAAIIARYAAGAELSLLAWWLQAGQPLPIDDIASATQQLVLGGLAGALGADLPPASA